MKLVRALRGVCIGPERYLNVYHMRDAKGNVIETIRDTAELDDAMANWLVEIKAVEIFEGKREPVPETEKLVVKTKPS